MRLRHGLIVVGSIFVGCGPNSHIVPDRVACGRCEIEVTTQLELGTEDGSGSLVNRPTHIVRDSMGRFWVTMLDFGFPYVFDAAGQFIQQVGKPGFGPGEFMSAHVVAALPGDSVLLSTGRSYLVVGPNLSIDRMILGPSGFFTGPRVSTWPSEVLAGKHVYAPSGQSMHIVSLDLSGERIIEQDTLAQVDAGGSSLYRWVDTRSPGGVWVSDVTRYMLRRFGPERMPLDSVERRPAWFPPGDRIWRGTPNEAPTPFLSAFRRDAEGRLWVFLNQPRSDWRDAWRGISFPTGVTEIRSSALPPGFALYQTVVEILDVDRLRVVARTTIDGHVFAVLDHDQVATFTELESGIPVVKILRLELAER